MLREPIQNLLLEYPMLSVGKRIHQEDFCSDETTDTSFIDSINLLILQYGIEETDIEKFSRP
jgi:hypothetical protein